MSGGPLGGTADGPVDPLSIVPVTARVTAVPPPLRELARARRRTPRARALASIAAPESRVTHLVAAFASARHAFAALRFVGGATIRFEASVRQDATDLAFGRPAIRSGRNGDRIESLLSGLHAIVLQREEEADGAAVA